MIALAGMSGAVAAMWIAVGFVVGMCLFAIGRWRP